MKSLNQYRLLSICIVILLFGCENNKNTEINLIYIFDVSGSFHKQSLNESVSLSERIFDEIISPNGVPFRPQTHQVSTIDEMSVTLGSNCFTRVNQANIFDESNTEDPKSNFKDCIENVLKQPPSQSTDIRGALLTASKSLQNNDLKGKGIIIFSDLHEYINEKKDYPLSLEDVAVFVIFEWSTAHLRNPELQQRDMDNFITMLEEAGCSSSDIKFMNLSSVVANPEVVSNWFRKRF